MADWWQSDAGWLCADEHRCPHADAGRHLAPVSGVLARLSCELLTGDSEAVIRENKHEGHEESSARNLERPVLTD